jgi:hypothetical protein
VQAVGNCQFVFLKHKTSETLTKIFVKRLQRAFSAVELNMADYVVMQPALTDAAYHRLNDLADVFLDSLGTAGTTTTLEAITYNLPIVTLPGEFMRGRVSHGILKQIGVTETIATSVDDYIEIANRLGTDVSWRQKVRKLMEQNKHKVYGDMACIEVFNVCSASGITIRDLAERIVTLADQNPERLVFTGNSKSGDSNHWIGCNKKLCSRGFSLNYSLSEGLADTVDWFRQSYTIHRHKPNFLSSRTE